MLLSDSSDLYSGRNFGPVWICRKDDAWVGCHPGGIVPLGELANRELRRAKMAAHKAFDQLWRRKAAREGITEYRARSLGYQWLAKELNIIPQRTHIGMFSVEQCQRVVELCAPYTRTT